MLALRVSLAKPTFAETPIAFFGYMALHSLFGYDPFYFHLYSVLLHIGCVCLVWRFIQTILRMHGGMAKNDILFVAFVTTILFAVHPLNVESVAWCSAVKVLLYAFFYLLGLLCYLAYIQNQKVIYYIATILCFLCSFLGKEQAVTFPLALLVVDWFANRKLKNVALWSEKMVFFIMALFFGIVTILSQGKGLYEVTYTLPQRLVFGCFALIEYITKSLLPVNLNFFYPYPIVIGEELPASYYLYPILVLFLTGWIGVYRKNRYLLFGVLLFIVNLLFSIHILNMSRHAIVADRYMYLSYVGLAFLMGYGLLWVKQKQPAYLKTALGILFVYLIFLSAYTFQYTKKWKNTTMVKEYTKEVLDKRLKQSGDF